MKSPVSLALDPLRALSHSGEGRADNDSQLAIDSLPVALPGLILDAHMDRGAVGPGGGVWPAAILSVGQGPTAVTAIKRVTVNTRDLSQWNDLARPLLGKDVCTTGAPTAGCLDLKPRTPNRNPVIEGLKLARGRDAHTPFATIDGPVVLAPGEAVRIAPVLSDDSIERYQELDATLKNHEIFVAAREEDLVVSWFATDGDLADALTSRSTTKTLDNRYIAPGVIPAGGKVTLWIVVRDQRGGTAWRQLLVTIFSQT